IRVKTYEKIQEASPAKKMVTLWDRIEAGVSLSASRTSSGTRSSKIMPKPANRKAKGGCECGAWITALSKVFRLVSGPIQREENIRQSVSPGWETALLARESLSNKRIPKTDKRTPLQMPK